MPARLFRVRASFVHICQAFGRRGRPHTLRLRHGRGLDAEADIRIVYFYR